MTQEISVNLVCILMRENIEIWVEKERAEKLTEMLKQPNCPQFIEYNGQLINKSDIAGVFDAGTMEERTRRKNGQWKCEFGSWHDKGSKCEGKECFLENHKEYKALKSSIGDDFYVQSEDGTQVINSKYRSVVQRINEIKAEAEKLPSKYDGTVYSSKF